MKRNRTTEVLSLATSFLLTKTRTFDFVVPRGSIMDFIFYNRSVNIQSSIEEVKTFVNHVPNLLKWTQFFLAIEEVKEERYTVQTKFGQATTWIELIQTLSGYQLNLHSLFGTRLESALIHLETNELETRLTFEIHLPTQWTEEQTNSQLQQLQGELFKLKALIEIESGLSSVKSELERQERSIRSRENFYGLLIA
ncbi:MULTISPECIES: hypothetical protein [unclassified Microcystis]|uniref:hypothetical protein n=2 Tax=unclassified Microcystis TaxID=2643300 RepID=UPI0022C0CAAE|nr:MULTISPECIES: hypothetical protein [unclassified Microcystis]MCZ8306436.1 hypothetical protein [Microcystis sp. LE19-98.1E]